MAQSNDNQDDPRSQQAEEQAAPVYGEAQAIPQQQTVRLSLPYAQPRAIWVLLALNIVIFAVPWLLAWLGVRWLGFPIDLVVARLVQRITRPSRRVASTIVS